MDFVGPHDTHGRRRFFWIVAHNHRAFGVCEAGPENIDRIRGVFQDLGVGVAVGILCARALPQAQNCFRNGLRACPGQVGATK
jgi:hypothetical protein